MSIALVGRQPILDRRLLVYGYELLFRAPVAVPAQGVDGDRATAHVLISALSDIGLDRVARDGRAFVNMTRNLLLGMETSCLPPERIVLEVLEDVEPDAEVLEAVRRLSAEGFTIALDDYVYRAELDPLLELADIVKIDLPRIERDELAEQIDHLHRHHVRVLAEKVETREEFELCKSLGCDYFQGYFFCRPHIVKQRKIEANQVAVIRLLAGLYEPGVGPGEIEELLRIDPSLCFKVLRLANSAQLSTDVPIASIRHAASMLGVSRLRSFASMLLMASTDSDKSPELFCVAMTRGRMCEMLANSSGIVDSDHMFVVGLFSVFDAILDVPMEEVVQALSLGNEFAQALLSRDGPAGCLLDTVIRHESSQCSGDSLLPLDQDLVADAYVEAIVWATSCLDALG